MNLIRNFFSRRSYPINWTLQQTTSAMVWGSRDVITSVGTTWRKV